MTEFVNRLRFNVALYICKIVLILNSVLSGYRFRFRMSTVIDCPDPTIPNYAWFQRTPGGHAVVGCRRRDVTHRDVTHRDVTWKLECDSGLRWKHDVTDLLQNCSSRKYATVFWAFYLLTYLWQICWPVSLATYFSSTRYNFTDSLK